MKQLFLSIYLICAFAAGLTAQTGWAQDAPEAEAEMSAEEKAYIEEANAFLEQLTPQHGEIKLARAGVTLNLPENYYFLGAKGQPQSIGRRLGQPA